MFIRTLIIDTKNHIVFNTLGIVDSYIKSHSFWEKCMKIVVKVKRVVTKARCGRMYCFKSCNVNQN